MVTITNEDISKTNKKTPEGKMGFYANVYANQTLKGEWQVADMKHNPNGIFWCDEENVSRTAVTNSMRLLKLNEKVQQMLVDEMLTTGHARALLGIEDQEEQYVIAQKIFDEKMSVRDIEKLVKKLQKEKSEKEKTVKQPVETNEQMQAIYHDLEEKMKTIFGTKVTINSKDMKKGKIEIEYYSSDELDHLMDLIQSIQK